MRRFVSLSFAATFLMVAGAAAVRAHAPPGHFVVVGDGTVRDRLTGLVWQQDSSPIPLSLADARAYCASLVLAGGGWRVPAVLELRSIVDVSVTMPAIDLMFFPGTSSESFWSNTPTAGVPTGTWFVMFDRGQVINDQILRLTTMRVRCVR